MLRNAIRPGVEELAVVESARLRLAADFGFDVASTHRPAAATSPVARFQHGAGIAKFAQFVGRRQPGQTRAEDDDALVVRLPVQPQRASVVRRRGDAQRAGRSVRHRSPPIKASNLRKFLRDRFLSIMFYVLHLALCVFTTYQPNPASMPSCRNGATCDGLIASPSLPHAPRM